MNTVEELCDEECLHDPIRLFDFEQSRVCFRELTCNVLNDLNDITICDKSDDKWEKTQSQCGNSQPLSFYHNKRNIELLRKCRPFSIRLIDCKQYPISKKYKKNEVSNCGNLRIEEIIHLDESSTDSVKGAETSVLNNSITLNNKSKTIYSTSTYNEQNVIVIDEICETDQKTKTLKQKSVSTVKNIDEELKLQNQMIAPTKIGSYSLYSHNSIHCNNENIHIENAVESNMVPNVGQAVTQGGYYAHMVPQVMLPYNHFVCVNNIHGYAQSYPIQTTESSYPLNNHSHLMPQISQEQPTNTFLMPSMNFKIQPSDISLCILTPPGVNSTALSNSASKLSHTNISQHLRNLINVPQIENTLAQVNNNVAHKYPVLIKELQKPLLKVDDKENPGIKRAYSKKESTQGNSIETLSKIQSRCFLKNEINENLRNFVRTPVSQIKRKRSTDCSDKKTKVNMSEYKKRSDHRKFGVNGEIKTREGLKKELNVIINID